MQTPPKRKKRKSAVLVTFGKVQRSKKNYFTQKYELRIRGIMVNIELLSILYSCPWQAVFLRTHYSLVFSQSDGHKPIVFNTIRPIYPSVDQTFYKLICLMLLVIYLTLFFLIQRQLPYVLLHWRYGNIKYQSIFLRRSD